MKTAILLSYKGLGSNLLHLSYCHEIAKKYGPITIITLCKNLEQYRINDLRHLEASNKQDGSTRKTHNRLWPYS